MTGARILAAAFFLACLAFCAFVATLWWVVYLFAPITAAVGFTAVLLALGARPADRAALYIVSAGVVTVAIFALLVLRR